MQATYLEDESNTTPRGNTVNHAVSVDAICVRGSSAVLLEVVVASLDLSVDDAGTPESQAACHSKKYHGQQWLKR